MVVLVPATWCRDDSLGLWHWRISRHARGGVPLCSRALMMLVMPGHACGGMSFRSFPLQPSIPCVLPCCLLAAVVMSLVVKGSHCMGGRCGPS